MAPDCRIPVNLAPVSVTLRSFETSAENGGEGCAFPHARPGATTETSNHLCTDLCKVRVDPSPRCTFAELKTCAILSLKSSDDDGFLLFSITCLRKIIFAHKTRDFMKSFISSSTLMSWQDVHILEALLCVAFAAHWLRQTTATKMRKKAMKTR